MRQEVKSIRQKKVNIQESYARVKDGEVFIVGMNISPYEMGNRFNHDALRERKLLLHKHEIRKLIGKLNEKGYTLVQKARFHQWPPPRRCARAWQCDEAAADSGCARAAGARMCAHAGRHGNDVAGSLPAGNW